MKRCDKLIFIRRVGKREGLLRCPADETPSYRYINAEPSRERLIGERVGPPQDPVAMKQIMDNSPRWRNRLHLEAISYTGSCDARAKNQWFGTKPDGTLVPIGFDPPPKLANVPKPYCYPILTEIGETQSKGCYRWHSIVRFSATNKLYRRHYGGDDIATNGMNWLFADGHVQWHSAAYAHKQLVCCIGVDTLIVNTSHQADINTHCQRP